MNTNEPLHVVSCDVLRKELEYLTKKNRWSIAPTFLSSNLHVSLDSLERALLHALDRPQPSDCMIYGVCHPRMDRICADRHIVRTPVQNCIEMLIGKSMFTSLLEDGAFFILEQWAFHWNTIASEVFIGSPSSRYEILKEEHEYILCLRTPCSTNFYKEAEAVSEETGLPLQWRDVSLHHMEEVLLRTFEQAYLTDKESNR